MTLKWSCAPLCARSVQDIQAVFSFLPGIGIPFCLESEFLLRGHSFSHISNLQHRDDLGLNTRFDATMSSVLNQALAAYENERVIGVSTGNEVGGRAGKR